MTLALVGMCCAARCCAAMDYLTLYTLVEPQMRCAGSS